MEKLCKIVGCPKKARSRMMCPAHYERWRKTDPPELNEKFRRHRNPDGSRKLCLVPECDTVNYAQGMCRPHYSSFHYYSTRGADIPPEDRRTKRTVNGVLINPVCEFEGCGRKFHKAGLCSPHYAQKRKGRRLTEIKSSLKCSIPWCEDEYSNYRGVYPFCKVHVDTRRRFNLTSERLIEVVSPAVCQNPGCDETERLFIDHDHSCCKVGVNATSSRVSCGKCVRGLLCSGCNSALGMLKENPQKIWGLLGYLEQYGGLAE